MCILRAIGCLFGLFKCWYCCSGVCHLGLSVTLMVSRLGQYLMTLVVPWLLGGAE